MSAEKTVAIFTQGHKHEMSRNSRSIAAIFGENIGSFSKFKIIGLNQMLLNALFTSFSNKETCFMCQNDSTNNQRRLILQALATGSLLSFSANGAPRSIHHLSGQVYVNGRLARQNTLIKAGDNIETTRNSSIVFVVDNDAYMLRENSRLSLIVRNNIIDTLRLFSGKLLSVFGSGRKNLQTPIATIGIRGTGTYMTAEPYQTYFCTCYGTVEVASWQSSSMAERITGTHHNARIITATNQQNWSMLPAPFVDHTDDELIMLESLMGRKPPFVS